MNNSQKNIKQIKNIIIYLHLLHRQNKISDKQLDYLLRRTCAYFIELQLQNLLDTYLPLNKAKKIAMFGN